MAALAVVLLPLAVATGGAGAAGADQTAKRVVPALAVFTVRNACGSPETVVRNYLVVAFEAAEMIAGNRYVLVATWPANARRFPFLFELIPRRTTFATRGVRLHPFVAGDPIPRAAFVAHLELDNLGPARGSLNLVDPTPSNAVTWHVAACR